MDTRWRQGGIFVAGLAAGVLIAAVATLSTHRDEKEVADAKPDGAPAAVARTTPAPAPQRTAACTFAPVVAGSGKGDGQISLAEPDARIAIVRGKEAMASGRDRDAEIAFITACRAAAKAAPAGSVEIADAEYQLARHYAGLAQERVPNRAELMRRAKPLYEDSLRIYLSQLGDHHEKTRFAAEGLASLKQESVQAATRPTRAPTPEAMAPRPRAPITSQAMGAAAAPDVVAQPQPSFDCDKAKSAPEKLICGDAELAQLDRELGTIYARAKSIASDPEAFQRVSDREWRRRETECGDRDCLLRWYAQRKHQLQEQIETAEGELTQR
jgi:hypothetical protein